MTALMFGVGAAEARSKAAGGGVAVNVLKEQRGKKELALFPRPGFTNWADFEDAGCRCAIKVIVDGEEYTYAVHNKNLRKIDKNKTITDLGDLGTSSGRVYMRSNGTEIGIVDGVNFYALTLATDALATRTLPAGVNPTHIAYAWGFFLINDKNSGDIYHNENSYDTTSWNVLDQSNAEYAPDDILALHDVSGNIPIFGEETTEIWTYTGALSFVFGAIPGMTYNYGIAAKDSFASIADAGFFLARDAGGGLQVVMLSRGVQAEPIGDPDVIGEISRYSTVEDATGLGLNIEGHPLYILNFPSEDVTWVYDASIKAGSPWCKWESYDQFDSSRGRFFAEHAVFFNDKQYLTSYEDGGLYEVSTSIYSDNGDPLIATVDALEINQGGKYYPHKYVNLFMETGHGLSDSAAQGHDPKVRLGYSDDHGHTWTWRDWQSIGKVGEYQKQVKFRCLGSTKHRKYRVQISDPVEWALMSPSFVAIGNET